MQKETGNAISLNGVNFTLFDLMRKHLSSQPDKNSKLNIDQLTAIAQEHFSQTGRDFGERHTHIAMKDLCKSGLVGRKFGPPNRGKRPILNFNLNWDFLAECTVVDSSKAQAAPPNKENEKQQQKMQKLKIWLTNDPDFKILVTKNRKLDKEDFRDSVSCSALRSMFSGGSYLEIIFEDKSVFMVAREVMDCELNGIEMLIDEPYDIFPSAVHTLMIDDIEYSMMTLGFKNI